MSKPLELLAAGYADRERAASAPLVARNLAGADGQLLRQPLEDKAAEAITQAGAAVAGEPAGADRS